MPVTVDDLLNKPFRTRRYEEKLQIVLEGRPCPSLLNLMNVPKEKKEEFIKQFSKLQYDLAPWLTGCGKRGRLFCWACLLFVTEKGAWNYSGYSGAVNLNSSMQKHDKSIPHVQAVMDLHMFTKQIKVPVINNCMNELEIAKYNDLVQKNRDVLKRIIDTVCYLVTKQQQTSNKIERFAHPQVDDCVELLQLIQNYDTPCVNYIDDAITLLHKSTLYADIVHAIANVVKEAIKEEIRGTTYVSIILNETSDIGSKSQLSVMLRFVREGKIYERFVGFTNVFEYKSSNVLFKHISKVVQDFDIQEKLVGQSYDGAVATSNNLKDLIFKMRSTYPYAFFVPCYSHEFERILQHSLSHIKECESFFKTLDGLAVYFSEDSKKRKALEDYMNEKLCGSTNTACYIITYIAGVIRNYRKRFLEFFELLIKNSDKWDANDVIKARGYIEFLQEFQTIFLLEIFSKVFAYTENLGKALKSETPESVFSNRSINEVKKHIMWDKENGFENLWLCVITESLDFFPSEPKRLKLEVDDEIKLQYRELFHKIMDYLLEQIDFRCDAMIKLEFFHLINPDRYERNYQKFPDSQVEKLFVEYIGLFEHRRLKNELRVLFSHCAFVDKKAETLLEFLVQEKLTSNFREMSKLVQLILTLPCKAPLRNCPSSTMTSFTDWSYISENQDITRNNLSFLYIERNLLAKVKKGPNFYENVVNEFEKINKNMKLTYK